MNKLRLHCTRYCDSVHCDVATGPCASSAIIAALAAGNLRSCWLPTPSVLAVVPRFYPPDPVCVESRPLKLITVNGVKTSAFYPGFLNVSGPLHVHTCYVPAGVPVCGVPCWCRPVRAFSRGTLSDACCYPGFPWSRLQYKGWLRDTAATIVFFGTRSASYIPAVQPSTHATI